MFKKFLILPIIGLFSLGAFASADTVDGFTSDNAVLKLSNVSLSKTNGRYRYNFESNIPSGYYDYDPGASKDIFYLCINSNIIPYNYSFSSNGKFISINSENYCFSSYTFLNDSLFFENNNSYDLYVSKSQISYVAPEIPDTPDNGDSSLMPGSPDSFTSGFKPFVDSFISALSGFIPLVILYGLPILLIYIFWKRIRSYLKHFLIGGELPKGDDIANCRVYIDDKGNIKHDFSVNGYKRAVSMGNLFDQDMNTGNNRNKYSYTEQVAYGQDVYIRHDRSKSVDNAEIMDYTGQFHEAVFIRGSGYVAKRDLDCLNEDMTFNRDRMIKKYKGTNPYDALD